MPNGPNEAGEVRDPRKVITPDAFSVAPELIGTPLARPIRRAAAMLVDLVLIAVLANAGGIFLGLVTALLFLRIAAPSRGDQAATGRKRPLRAAFAGVGALILLVTVLAAWGDWSDRGDQGAELEVVGDEFSTEVTFGEAATFITDLIALRRADSEPEAREAAARIAGQMQRRGLTTVEIREALEDIAEDAEPWMSDVVRSVLAQVDTVDALDKASVDSLVLSYAQAVSSGDTLAAAALRPRLAGTLARDSLELLETRIKQLREVRATLDERIERAEERRGLLHLLALVSDEVGVGFGWSGLYFTLFLTLWRGRTPGKRLLGIRVVRLDGKPIGWWAAFNRFGGYAASIFTGLLGFCEMFWDANRQALHDRIANTVVVKETSAGRHGATEP